MVNEKSENPLAQQVSVTPKPPISANSEPLIPHLKMYAEQGNTTRTHTNVEHGFIGVIGLSVDHQKRMNEIVERLKTL